MQYWSASTWSKLAVVLGLAKHEKQVFPTFLWHQLAAPTKKLAFLTSCCLFHPSQKLLCCCKRRGLWGIMWWLWADTTALILTPFVFLFGFPSAFRVKTGLRTWRIYNYFDWNWSKWPCESVVGGFSNAAISITLNGRVWKLGDKVTGVLEKVVTKKEMAKSFGCLYPTNWGPPSWFISLGSGMITVQSVDYSGPSRTSVAMTLTYSFLSRTERTGMLR